MTILYKGKTCNRKKDLLLFVYPADALPMYLPSLPSYLTCLPLCWRREGGNMVKGTRIRIGLENFKTIIDSEYCYVDNA
jgi:hypothetical protein